MKIMGNFRHLLLLLGLFGLEVAAQNETLTIAAVTSQIDEFLKLIQNGSLATREASSLPTGCSLAVCNPSSRKDSVAEFM